MKRLAIIVEGYTEYYFVENILKKHLPKLNITAINLCGGGISFKSVLGDAKILLHNYDYVTTLVDYYQFRKPEHMQTIDDIENGLEQAISNKKFIPYLQKHEFEALVFSDIARIQDNLGENSQLQKIRQQPEEINHNEPPSKLLMRIFPDYNKTSDGITILKATSWNTIRQECPRFNEWITKLETLG
ncbi:MAG: DUF4276 family protein [Alphaproteobacteria bacterium]|nr:DUF4276 family protein [Alphaproteobacteria bacterium]